MPFILVPFPTVRQIARLASDALADPVGMRILAELASGVRLAIDADRDAYLIHVSSTGRQNSGQFHYLLFFRGRFFCLRTKNFQSLEVGFYDFPDACEAERPDVQQCFTEAACVYGWFGDIRTPEENAAFVPVFGADDWEPTDF